MKPSVSPRFEFASLITPQLYLSDYLTSQNKAKLEELGITHVVSLLSTGAPNLPTFIPADQRLYINIVDNHGSDILQHLDRTTSFITKAISEDRKNKVLVHCRLGISRSATVVCAYLVATTEMSVSEAIKHARSSRDVVCPNSGFWKQLESYSTQFVKTKPSKPLKDCINQNQ